MSKYALTLLFLLGLAVLPTSLALQSSARTDEPPPRPPTITPFTNTRLILSPERGVAVSSVWWTVVQWQDERGQWQDVEGWQGTFDESGRVIWWVGPEHFGDGPFRWVVYDAPDEATVLATSKPFHLPTNTYELLEVKVELP